MIFFQMPVVILVALLHLLPVVLFLLTRSLPWEKARDRLALARVIGSAGYLLTFPCLISRQLLPLGEILFTYYAEGWVLVLPLLTAGLLTALLALASQGKRGGALG